MAKLSIVKGATSVLVRIFIQDSTSTTGAGKTGLTAASFTGTKAYVARDDDGNAAGTAVNLTDATRGTWSSGGIKEKDSTNMPGVYEFGLTNASIATGSRSCTYEFIGSGIAPLLLEIELTGIDNQDAVHGGMTAIPNTAVTTNGSLLTSGTGTAQVSVSSGQVLLQTGSGTGQLDFTSGVVKSSLAQILGTALTEGAAGRIAAAFQAAWNVASSVWTSASFNQTGDAFARLGAPVAASTSADIANVQTKANTINGQLPTTLQSGRIDASVGAYQTGLHINMQKNTACAGFMFLMIDSSDHISVKTGLTVAGTVALDGGSFGSLTNAVSELASGWYKVDLAAADLNGNNVALKFTAAGADPTNIYFRTQP